MGNKWGKLQLECTSYAALAAEEGKAVYNSFMESGKQRLNILVVGLPGVGKSTFISSLQSCLTGDHGSEVGISGKLEMGDSFTFRLKRYPFSDAKFGKLLGGKVEVRAPVVFDMPGLPNVDDERLHAILTCILKGRVPVNASVLIDAGMNRTEIEERYTGNEDSAKNRIDRVFFIHSCQVERPDNILKLVKEVCQQADVTTFTVLTHTDKGNAVCSEKDLELALGTFGSPRGCAVELYYKIPGQYGKYLDKPETNYHLLRMWKGILNDTYTIHSEQP